MSALLLAALAANDEAEAMAMVRRLKDGEAQLCSLTGKTTTGEALAVCSAWKEGAAKVATIEAQLAARAKAEADAGAVASIELAVSERRLAPGRKEVASKLYAEHGPAALTAFLSALTPIVGGAEVTPPETAPNASRMSADDEWAAKALGISSDVAAKAVQDYGR